MNITLELQKLDDLIVTHTTPPVTAMLRNKLHPLRDQLEAYITAKEKELNQTSELEGRNQYLVAENLRIISEKNEIEAKQVQSDAERLKVGATLKNGQKVMYEADAYAILPNNKTPQVVEFRKVDTAQHTYQTVAHAKWADVSEIHGPPA